MGFLGSVFGREGKKIKQAAGINTELREQFIRLKEHLNESLESEGAELQACYKFYRQRLGVMDKIEQEIIEAGKEEEKYVRRSKVLLSLFREQAQKMSDEWDRMKENGEKRDDKVRYKAEYEFLLTQNENRIAQVISVLIELTNRLKKPSLEDTSRYIELKTKLVNLTKQGQDVIKILRELRKKWNYDLWSDVRTKQYGFWKETGEIIVESRSGLSKIPITTSVLRLRKLLELELGALATATLQLDTQLKVLEHLGVSVLPRNTEPYLERSIQYLTAAARDTGNTGFIETASKAAMPVYWNRLTKTSNPKKYA